MYKACFILDVWLHAAILMLICSSKLEDTHRIIFGAFFIQNSSISASALKNGIDDHLYQIERKTWIGQDK